MFDSDEQPQNNAQTKYSVGQDLYAASIEDMQAWVEALRLDITRLEAEIEKKRQERRQADEIFKTHS